MIHAVLFDLDGTLFDRASVVQTFISRQHERLNLQCDRDAYLERFLALDKNGTVWKDKVYTQLVEEFSLPFSMNALLADYIIHFPEYVVPFPHLEQLLSNLKAQGQKLAIVSNGIGQFQLSVIHALGMEQYFDAILISDWEKLRKPDARLFQRACDKLGVSVEESLFVGDNPEVDIDGAKGAGMLTAWKKSGDQQVNADYVVDDLLDIETIIQTTLQQNS
ncbi:HAD family hydrolase [Kurthia massiliensis]|uniref:HAD family hydrolase n=1 Tax=Kurthia massiliensis TaxID=1033739 RepID=UPI00028821A5|nr:HAD family hydrolase [Kurthia massiliensis]